jgi:tetratricopeptide (TPR) repeat protein
MPHARPVHVLLLVLVLLAPTAFAQTAPQVQAMLESRAPGALAAAEALVKKTPGDASAWIMLTRARLQARQPAKAIDAAEKAVALGPKNAQAFYWLGNAYGNRIGEVNMLSKMSLAPKLRDAFETAVELDPALLDARSSLVEFYLQAPAVVGGGVDKAKAQAAAIGRYDRFKGLLAEARIAGHEKNTAKALKLYESARVLKPGDPQARMLVLSAYQQAEQWRDAYDTASRWAIDEPANPKPRYQIGRIAAVSGQYLSEGEVALRKYLQLPRKPDDPEPKHARYRLGQVLAHAGRKDEARVELQAALKLDPSFAEAREALAKL